MKIHGFIHYLILAVYVTLRHGAVCHSLIPRRVLLSSPDYSAVQLSPDGQWLSWVARHNGAMHIWVRNLSNKTTTAATAVPVSVQYYAGINGYVWAFDNEHILFGNDNNGDENYKLYKVNVKTKSTKSITDTAGVRAVIVALSPKRPKDIVIGMNDRDLRFHDLYEINIDSGKHKLVLLNTLGFHADGFIFDEQLRLKLASKLNQNAEKEFYQRSDDGKWSLYRTVGADEVATSILTFDQTQTRIYWLDNTFDDKLCLIVASAENPDDREILHAPKKSDVTGVFFHPLTKVPQMVAEEYMKSELFFLNFSLILHFDMIKVQAWSSEGEFSIVSSTLNFDVWIILHSSEHSPGTFYLYNATSKLLQRLFDLKAQFINFSFSETTANEIATRDGLTQVCYLTLPQEVTLKATLNRPIHPLPMVLSVHGGPNSKHGPGFNPAAQFIANRGYVHLSCNFRGSTGYGKRFLKAGNGEWGGKMQDDLLDAVNWAILEQIADPERIAIIGASYGGFAVLTGLTQIPELFACGVDVVGPSNLVTMLNSTPPYWSSQRAQLVYRLGADLDTAPGRQFLESRSPLFRANRIRRPLLVAQGANDPRVNRLESDRIVGALRDKGIPVAYVLFPDEGHSISRPENGVAFFAIVEHFLKRCLGGKAEAYGSDRKNSSMILLTGEI